MTLTLRLVLQVRLRSIDPQQLADLVGPLQEGANDKGLPPAGILSLVDARRIPLPIILLTCGEE
jgi:hypothetical protein